MHNYLQNLFGINRIFTTLKCDPQKLKVTQPPMSFVPKCLSAFEFLTRTNSPSHLAASHLTRVCLLSASIKLCAHILYIYKNYLLSQLRRFSFVPTIFISSIHCWTQDCPTMLYLYNICMCCLGQHRLQKELIIVITFIY